MLPEKLLDPFFDTILSEDIGYYQGDKLMVLRNKNEYGWRWSDSGSKVWGFLVSGYGSCSGCDSWEGAETGTAQFEQLAEEIGSIKWFPTLKALQDYIGDKYARELEWYAHESEYKTFVDNVSALKDPEGGTDG